LSLTARPSLLQVLVLLLGLALPAQAREKSWRTDLSAHILLAEIGETWGAASDLTLAVRYVMIHELALGVEGAVLLPLPTSGEVQETDVAFRANPAVWMLFGDPEMWSYLKLGCGVDSHLRNGKLDPVMALVASAGFGVAPRELKFHFGFEISGELDILGEVTTRTIGVGGFVGLRF